MSQVCCHLLAKGDAMANAEIQVLEMALEAVSSRLNALVTSCIDDRGAIQAPTQKDIMQARAALPPYCSMAFVKKQN